MQALKAISHPRAAELYKASLQLFVLGASALVFRVATFGHPNIHPDETFYFLVGQLMHQGWVPYVDIWDRKPFGLFALFYLMAGISDSVLSYQITAWIFVSLTAFTICRIVEHISGRKAGLLSGLTYIALLPVLAGFGGQAPIFYNLPIAVAAYIVLRALPSLRAGVTPRSIYGAMALCGLALTIKQTAIFESIFLGLAVVWPLWKSGTSRSQVLRVASVCMFIGAAPTLAISVSYLLSGFWHEYWHAMVTSNFLKRSSSFSTLSSRSIGVYVKIAPIAAVSLMALVLPRSRAGGRLERPFIAGWLFAACVGFVSVPNIYWHYSLPLIVPLCACAGYFYARRDLGLVAFAIVVVLAVSRYDAFAFAYTRQAKVEFSALSDAIVNNGGERGLLIFDGPPLLYHVTGNDPLSALTLPFHINYAVEQNVSHLNTNSEIFRMLSRKPGVIVMTPTPGNTPINEGAWRMVKLYTQNRCELVDQRQSLEMSRTDLIVVYGNCR